MSLNWNRAFRRSVAVTCFLTFSSILSPAQQISKFDRDHAQSILREVAADIEKHYYDPKLHGVDWGARVQQAKENIDKTDSLDGALSEIAALLDSLNDSHTFLIPPARAYVHDYGFTMQMIGEHCRVTRVTPGSDAEKKGLRAGDEVVALNGHRVSRKIFWKLMYLYKVLRPQPGLQLTLADSPGHERQIEVATKVQPSVVLNFRLHNGVNHVVREAAREGVLLRPRYVEKGDDLLVVRIPEFDLSAQGVDDFIGKMRKHKAVILDLRGNPGGFMETLTRLLGGMFQNDVKIFDRIQRTKSESVSAVGRHHDAFIGRFAVLIDSESASASEIFARVIQLEKRGFVLGDRSSGSVMEAQVYKHYFYFDSKAYYHVLITDANLTMTDGNSLEHTGVDPDIMILPTARDLAEQDDPVLAKAAGLLGVTISPEEAGKMFPYEGPLEN